MRDEQPSNVVAEARNWSDVMAKNIKIYLRGPVPKKMKPVPIEQRGNLVEFPKEHSPRSLRLRTLALKIDDL